MTDLEKHIEITYGKPGSKRRANFDKDFEEFRMGQMLQKERKKAGITQSEVAEKTNIKRSSISRIERHGKDIKLSTLKKIAGALGKRLVIHIV
ncbi:MAG: helix-turn-helix transcriptional regulator [Candidatus Margulisbacteria bacterium]|nr:helix-turn-helix transcriptional regulator [Candidatus Margulisiibacteriota bacterium]